LQQERRGSDPERVVRLSHWYDSFVEKLRMKRRAKHPPRLLAALTVKCQYAIVFAVAMTPTRCVFPGETNPATFLFQVFPPHRREESV
jgi:hypothetical protein